MSSLIMCQVFLRNRPLKLLGPGALSEDSFFITLSISSFVKGAQFVPGYDDELARVG
jgi:hypothetical protein